MKRSTVLQKDTIHTIGIYSADREVLLSPGQIDRNNWTQRIAPLLGTCCARLATLLRGVAPCWALKFELVRMPGRNNVARTCPNDYKIMQHPKMLMKNLTFFKFEPTTPNTSQHVATRRNRVAKLAQHAASNNVVVGCVDML